MEERRVCVTPSLRGFYENVGEIEGLELRESTLNTKKGDIVLFTGSILDKSEIDYRQITQTVGKYYTVIPSRLKLEEIDIYWFKNTVVVHKEKLHKLLASLILNED